MKPLRWRLRPTEGAAKHLRGRRLRFRQKLRLHPRQKISVSVRQKIGVFEDGVSVLARNFGNVFDELYSANSKNLTALLVKLLASHGHAARAHHAKLANLMECLFHKASDPRMNFVKEYVFGVIMGCQFFRRIILS